MLQHFFLENVYNLHCDIDWFLPYLFYFLCFLFISFLQRRMSSDRHKFMHRMNKRTREKEKKCWRSRLVYSLEIRSHLLLQSLTFCATDRIDSFSTVFCAKNKSKNVRHLRLLRSVRGLRALARRRPAPQQTAAPPRPGLERHPLRQERHLGAREAGHRGPALRSAAHHQQVSIFLIFNHFYIVVKLLFSCRVGDIILSVNGEIYNHMELEKTCNKEEFTTDSDCEVREYVVKAKEITHC